MSWKEELKQELTWEKIKPIKISYYGGVRVSFQNGMDFYIGGRWMEDGEYDDDGNQTNVCRINVFKKEGGTGFDSIKYEKKMMEKHPDYFQYPNTDVGIIKSEIEDMVADAVIEYFKKIEETEKDYKGIWIVYTDYKKEQNKQTKAEQDVLFDDLEASSGGNNIEGDSKSSEKISSDALEEQERSVSSQSSGIFGKCKKEKINKPKNMSQSKEKNKQRNGNVL